MMAVSRRWFIILSSVSACFGITGNTRLFAQDDDDDDDDDECQYGCGTTSQPTGNGGGSTDTGSSDPDLTSGQQSTTDDSSSGVDPVNDATGGRMSDSTGIQQATSDPTSSSAETGLSNIFDISNPQNSCLAPDSSSIANDVRDATGSTGDQSSFWSDKWFNFTGTAALGEPSNGVVQTDIEMGNAYVTGWVPVAGEGGVYGTLGTQGYEAVGVYVGAPNGLEGFAQTELSNSAPNFEIGVRGSIGELSVGIDAGPMVESGGRALEAIENNLYDYYSTTQFAY